MLPIRDSIPSETVPLVNWILIAANVGVFGYEISLPSEEIEGLIFQWGAVPANFNLSSNSFGGFMTALPTIVTSTFLHGGWGHLLGNMLFLWVFGDNVEDRLGHLRYLIFYLLCGVSASAIQIVAEPQSPIPIVGASGAIGGVMGAYMISFPRAQVLTFFWFFIFVRFFWVPAALYLLIWFGFQLFSALAAGAQGGEAAAQGGIAFWAHVGGFAAGMLFVKLLHRDMFRRRRMRAHLEDRDSILS